MTQNPQKSNKSRLQLHDLDHKSLYSSQLNNSTSKMLYSIPKSPRWKENSSQQIDYKFYDVPSLSSQRSTSFGYGDKTSVSNKGAQGPQPGTYIIGSQFDKRHKNAIAIGLGRQLVKAVSVFNEKSFKSPGPGTYDAKQIKSQQKIILSGRVNDLSEKWIREVPGPGTYKTLQLIDKNLKSNIRKFSKGEQRSNFEKQIKKKNIPGPSQYSTIKYEEVSSRFKHHKGQSFSLCSRPSIANRSFAPGPGHYNNFTDFVQ